MGPVLADFLMPTAIFMATVSDSFSIAQSCVSATRTQVQTQTQVQTLATAEGALLYTLYQSIHGETPWQRFAQQLRGALGARNVVITLHHMKQAGHDSYIMAGADDDAVDWFAMERVYRADFMAQDPLRLDRMEPGQVARSTPNRMSFLTQLALTDSLRLCVAEPLGMRCWFDIVRSNPKEPKFSEADFALLQSLLPHLENALSLFARLQRQETERFVYESMLDHLGLGCVLLNGVGHVLHMNPIVEKLMEQALGITVFEQKLKVSDRQVQKQLDQAIDTVILARDLGGHEIQGEIMRVGHADMRMLGLLVQPAPVRTYYRGQEAPCAIVYVSEIYPNVSLAQPAHARSVQRISSLFDLTRQEATLSLLLAFGASIAEAATKMEIGESAARNYSKKIYSKMGISGQADLVRVMLRSLSFLR